MITMPSSHNGSSLQGPSAYTASDLICRKPPNCSFEIDDFEADWPFARPFDYIHGRERAGSVKDFNRLFTQAYAKLKSVGFLEMQSFLNRKKVGARKKSMSSWLMLSPNFETEAFISNAKAYLIYGRKP